MANSLPRTDNSPLAMPANTIEASARWLDDADDAMLGCECANPALQIERWDQEAPSHSLAS